MTISKLVVLCAVAFIVFSIGIAGCHYSQQSQIEDEFNRRDPSLRTMMINHEALQNKFVIFLDIDGVVAPYGLDPNDDDADDDTSHFTYDDDLAASLQAHHCWRNFTEESMGAFSSILEAIPEGQSRVVLSSFWRIHADCRLAILEKFHDYGEKFGGPLKDFKWFDDRTAEIISSRQVEIGRWLRRFNPDDEVLAGWLVLDDREDVQFRGHMVRPNEDIGLTGKDAEKAIMLIKQQLGEA